MSLHSGIYILKLWNSFRVAYREDIQLIHESRDQLINYFSGFDVGVYQDQGEVIAAAARLSEEYWATDGIKVINKWCTYTWEEILEGNNNKPRLVPEAIPVRISA